MTPAQELTKIKKLTRQIFGYKTVKLITLLFVLSIIIPITFFLIVKPKPAKDITWGINFSQKYATELGLEWRDAYLKILDDLKPKTARLVIYWDQTELTKGNYSYTDTLWQLDEAKKRDVNVIMTLGRKVLRYPECHEPGWWLKESNADAKEKALLDYVANTVNQLKGYDNIIMWQVENEPTYPFGECQKQYKETVQKEVDLVRKLDNRPILIQDSGEGGSWRPFYLMGDYLGISMYRRTWFNFYKEFTGISFYFQYPIAHWAYKVKSVLTAVPAEKIIVTELQGEPWGPVINSQLTKEEANKTMSHEQFIDTIKYAQKSGFSQIYFWGPEWWLWEKQVRGDSFYWDTARVIIANSTF